MIINSDTLNEIDKKVDKLEGQRTDLASIVRGTLEDDALEHSQRLEDSQELDKTGYVVIEGLKDAWKYASSNFNGKLNDQFIIKIANLIDLRDNFENYRNEELTISGISNPMLPLRYQKIPRDMSKLISTINYCEDLHPIEKSAMAHLHTARIHPFRDGNGRTSRILQNIILQENGYSPATIKKEERDFYQGILRNAMQGYKEREGDTSFEEVWQSPLEVSDKESLFYEFIASKVNLSLNKQIEEVKSLPNYQIIGKTVENRNAREILDLENSFKKYLSENGILAIAKIIEEGQTLDVSGYIDKEKVLKIIETGYNNFMLKYSTNSEGEDK